jgi:hypothetical protein
MDAARNSMPAPDEFRVPQDDALTARYVRAVERGMTPVVVKDLPLHRRAEAVFVAVEEF